MKKILLWLITLMAIQGGYAQDTLKLNLQDAFDATIKNNREVTLSALDREIAVARFGQTNATFLPQVNLQYAALATNNPLHAFGFKLQQQSVSLTDFDPQLLNNPSTTQNYMTSVQWNQPLLNPEMIYQRKAAAQQIDVHEYKMKRVESYLILEVQKAYAQLQLSHLTFSVLGEALNTVNSILTSSKNYFEKGYLQKSNVLLVEVEVASIKNKMAEAKSNVLNASDYLGLLMNSQGNLVYLVDSLEKVNPIGEIETIVPEGRADFQALKSALSAQQMAARAEKMSRLPRLNAFASYTLNDETVFGFGSNSWQVGAHVSWNLFNGTATRYETAEQEFRSSRIEQQLGYEMEQAQLELNKTVRELQVAQFALEQYEASLRQAAEAFRIVQNRFQQGLESVNDLLQAQSTVSQQRLLLGEAVFKYNTTLAHLKFLTATNE
jgi:outer membrane protein TolC